jgi:hypothetical protein
LTEDIELALLADPLIRFRLLMTVVRVLTAAVVALRLVIVALPVAMVRMQYHIVP